MTNSHISGLEAFEQDDPAPTSEPQASDRLPDPPHWEKLVFTTNILSYHKWVMARREDMAIQNNRKFRRETLSYIARVANELAYHTAVVDFERNGDRGTCGSAWLVLAKEPNGRKITGNTQTGKLLKEAGIAIQDSTRRFTVGTPPLCQSLTHSELAAKAACDVWRDIGFDCSINTWID